ncbi:MAG: aminoacyl-tRNA hydrolase [Syntrophobacteraceae bacterium]|nr:aminoacyl-tRNA hydrolase [Syntrophobacteraceae bacterium]
MGDLSRNEEQILAVIGLGNPGKEYAGSRHNAGFVVLDRLIAHYLPSMMERKFRASWGFAMAEGRKVLFVKPLTYMNRSGEAVGELLKYFSIPPGRMLVVHDDLDLPFARIRIAQRGGSGGHRGIQSIMDHVGGPDFARLKIGVGRPKHGEPVEDFVLLPPYSEDRENFQKVIAQAEEAVRAVLAADLSEAMNRFNRRD